MKKYIIPFLAYVFLGYLLELFLDEYWSYAIRTIVVLGLVIYFWKDYNLKFKFDYKSILVGFLIFVIWILVDMSIDREYFIPENITFLIFKAIGMIAVAALIEELFTRDFLMRFLIDTDYKKVKIGTYGFYSFMITLLFFGFSHHMWLAGLITGIILNLWVYHTKSIENCIMAHASANLFLFIYVVVTSSYWLW